MSSGDPSPDRWLHHRDLLLLRMQCINCQNGLVRAIPEKIADDEVIMYYKCEFVHCSHRWNARCSPPPSHCAKRARVSAGPAGSAATTPPATERRSEWQADETRRRSAQESERLMADWLTRQPRDDADALARELLDALAAGSTHKKPDAMDTDH